MEGIGGMTELLMALLRGVCFVLFAYAGAFAGAFAGAIGWHAGRVYAARKYGPIRTETTSTTTIIDRTGEPL